MSYRKVNIISEELIDQHESMLTMMSEAEFWNLELRFFSKLLKESLQGRAPEVETENTENLASRLNHLKTQLKELKQRLVNHEKFLASIKSNGHENAEIDYDERFIDCVIDVAEFGRLFREYKLDIFEFAENHGASQDDHESE
jgi:hypothetical protein